MDSAQHAQLIQTIKGQLAAAGWKKESGTGVASKVFQTAVGPKVAHAYVSRGDGYNVTLSGDYQSEGRNALEPHGTLIPEGADEDAVRLLARKFAVNADQVISQTYAARLHQVKAVTVARD
ncbi:MULTISPECIES: hypothetical protein [unclassified Variovorax]|uniref:hypothetical protein n=1 Tax=unclassified Variovorax TaxID=663243 RepID=UPI00083965B7|nr:MULTISPECIES: hypothetical protein [unclassified Variovorax]PNG50398.1 hypothetical protein CHC06_06022 [Variovorax sp. B2]PNG51271.1 hypothetical protein CHC07_05928 [Variovorax sp. B4]VTU43164.1 hypothetical protein SRS16P1_00454 [Variovorax sp. SRS16]VTU43196.1 hypothetical protein E5P1_00451 [Variovorax sp. PBL-E5]VTU43401.1 hypothetical protein H6P1_00452 [Variovorax sp. PBL-H6]